MAKCQCQCRKTQGQPKAAVRFTFEGSPTEMGTRISVSLNNLTRGEMLTLCHCVAIQSQAGHAVAQDLAAFLRNAMWGWAGRSSMADSPHTEFAQQCVRALEVVPVSTATA